MTAKKIDTIDNLEEETKLQIQIDQNIVTESRESFRAALSRWWNYHTTKRNEPVTPDLPTFLGPYREKPEQKFLIQDCPDYFLENHGLIRISIPSFPKLQYQLEVFNQALGFAKDRAQITRDVRLDMIRDKVWNDSLNDLFLLNIDTLKAYLEYISSQKIFSKPHTFLLENFGERADSVSSASLLGQVYQAANSANEGILFRPEYPAKRKVYRYEIDQVINTDISDKTLTSMGFDPTKLRISLLPYDLFLATELLRIPALTRVNDALFHVDLIPVENQSFVISKRDGDTPLLSKVCCFSSATRHGRRCPMPHFTATSRLAIIEK